MRITGLATGLDVDSIITDTMSAYRTKIDQQTQKKDILEIKQKLYKDIMSESKTFYNKYFDILSSDSILNSSSWKSVSYTSISNVVKVTGSTDVKADNYTISGDIATAAKYVLEDKLKNYIIDGNKLTINGKSYTFAGASEKEIAKNLNAELQKDGVNITVKYSDFAGTATTGNKSGLVFESTKLGANNKFSIGGGEASTIGEVQLTQEGKKATAKSISGYSLNDIRNNIMEVDGISTFTFTMKKPDAKEGDPQIEDVISVNITSTHLEDDEGKKQAIKLINDELSKNNNFKDMYVELEGDNITFKTKTLGIAAEDFQVEIAGVPAEEIKLEGGTNATTTIKTVDNLNLNGQIIVNGALIDLISVGSSANEKVNYINDRLKEQGIGINVSLDEGNIKFEASNPGEYDISIKQLPTDDANIKFSEGGKDADIKITDGKGGFYNHTGVTNTFTKDGVTFSFTGEIPSEGISITGTNNVTDIKDKIVKLFNDYNSLVEKLNTLTTTKKNKGYDPLTDEQRSELSEKEVELWDAKVEAGQLYKDSDITRISNSLKDAMRTIVSGTGLTLEQIGISPVSDYAGTKNGTFTIDENKLTDALENNMDNIKNMFVQSKPTDSDLSSSQKYSQTGIFYRLKDILYSETMISTSSLAKKAGIDGTASATNNTLYKSIKEYEKKIEDMESAFTTKESALYSKYATLETLMNNLNSQQSYLYQSLGISTS